MPPFKLELIQFYLKYLLYKFFKEEVNALRKLKKNESKETAFENNGFNFVVNRYPDKISMKCYYFDILEIIFSISKYEKNNLNKAKNIKSYYHIETHPNSVQEIKEISDKTSNNYILVHNVMKFAEICLRNFLFNIKMSSNINNFLADVKKNNKKFADTTNSTVLKLQTLGVINGYEDNTFRGENNISRAEASVIICRAMRARRELTANRKYDLSNAEKLTNIGKVASYDSDYRNRYEIKNNKLYFYDDGRYANIDGFVLKNKNIDNKKIINLIKALIQEDAYVGVSYVPDKLLYDQLTVEYGRREGYVYNHSYAFSFIFYPDKQFELRKSSLNDNLSEECFMKIIVDRMWKDIYDMQNGEYSHELNNEKLLKALKTIFDNNTAKEIYEYIQQWLPKLFEDGEGNRFVEVKNIGDYEINLYTTGNSRVQIYISK